MTTTFLCTACGTSYPAAAAPPASCSICEDERQFVPQSGQGWTTRATLAEGYRNAWRTHVDDLLSLETQPKFGIGQRAFLLRTPAGNVLWDCVALLDTATETLVRGLGGLAAIAISHPHYYTTVQDWAQTFGAPVHLHAADRAWVMRPHQALRFWDGDQLPLLPDVTLVRLGGHFAGGTVLHWARGSGTLLVGDTIQVSPGGRRVSFMWSYPNAMPLPAATIRLLIERLQPWRYERLFGAFADQDVPADALDIVARSARRYIELLSS